MQIVHFFGAIWDKFSPNLTTNFKIYVEAAPSISAIFREKH